MYEEYCTWRLVSLLFDDLRGHSYPFTFLMFFNVFEFFFLSGSRCGNVRNELYRELDLNF